MTASVTALANGLYQIESSSRADLAHVVDPQKGTCSCEHFQMRLIGTGRTCRHIDAVRTHLAPTIEDRFREAVSTASRVPDALLPVLLDKHGDNPVVQTALIYERARRDRAAAENEKRLRMFR